MVQVVTVLGCPRPVGAVCEYPTCVEEGHCEAGPYPGSDKSQTTVLWPSLLDWAFREREAIAMMKAAEQKREAMKELPHAD